MAIYLMDRKRNGGPAKNNRTGLIEADFRTLVIMDWKKITKNRDSFRRLFSEAKKLEV